MIFEAPWFRQAGLAFGNSVWPRAWCSPISWPASRYRDAADHLDAAARDPDRRVRALQLRIYARCAAGDREQAQQVASERHAEMGEGAGPYWRWMATRCGVNPLRVTNAQPSGASE